MATTTTNFGWDIPQSTDLVKDGATAIAALGQDIDTALVDLKGGTTGQVLAKASGTDLDFSWVAQDDSNAIQNAIVDAKGDLIAASAADTPARLAVGTNGQVLTADSTAGTGLAWTTPASGGMTLLSTTTLTGSSVSISVTPTGYTALQMYIKDAYGTVDDVQCRIRFNSDTGTNYGYSAVRYDGGSVSGVGEISANSIPYIFIAIPSNNTTLRKGNAFVNIYSPNSTDNFAVNWQGYGFKNAGTGGSVAGNGIYDGSAAITSIQFSPGSGSWAGGTVYLYGVK